MANEVKKRKSKFEEKTFELGKKTMSLIYFISSFKFVIDMSYQRFFVSNIGFINSFLTLFTKKDTYISFFSEIGGKTKILKNEEVFSTANGQHRVTLIILFLTILAGIAIRNSLHNLARKIINSFCALPNEYEYANIDLVINNLNLEVINDKTGKNENLKITIKSYLSYALNGGSLGEFHENKILANKELRAKNNYLDAICLLDLTFKDLFNKKLIENNNSISETLEEFLDIMDNRISIEKRELAAWISEADYYKETNSYSNPQEDENFTEVSIVSNTETDIEKVKVAETKEKINIIATNICKSETHVSKFKRHLYKSVHMVLAFKNESDCKFIAVETDSVVNKLSSEVQSALEDKKYTSITFIDKAYEYSLLMQELLDQNNTNYLYTVIRSFYNNIGETKTRFLPSILAYLSNIKYGVIKYPSVIEVSALITTFAKYLLQRNLVLGGNSEKAADTFFPLLVLKANAAGSTKTFINEFKSTLDSLLFTKEQIESGFIENKKLSKTYMKLYLILANDILIRKSFNGKGLENELEAFYKNADLYEREHVYAESLNEIKSLLEDYNLSETEINEIASYLNSNANSIENAILVTKSLNNELSNKRPGKKTKKLKISSRTTPLTRYLPVRKDSDLMSLSNLKQANTLQFEEYKKLLLKDMFYRVEIESDKKNKK